MGALDMLMLRTGAPTKNNSRHGRSPRNVIRRDSRLQRYLYALEQVPDPELETGIVLLGLVYDVEVLGRESDRALVTMTLTSPTSLRRQ